MGYQRLSRYRKVDSIVMEQPKRNFNFAKGVKSCIDDISEFFGLETAGDKAFYYGCLGIMVAIPLFVFMAIN